jgi:hypothetical protein
MIHKVRGVVNLLIDEPSVEPRVGRARSPRDATRPRARDTCMAWKRCALDAYIYDGPRGDRNISYKIYRATRWRVSLGAGVEPRRMRQCGR